MMMMMMMMFVTLPPQGGGIRADLAQEHLGDKDVAGREVTAQQASRQAARLSGFQGKTSVHTDRETKGGSAKREERDRERREREREPWIAVAALHEALEATKIADSQAVGQGDPCAVICGQARLGEGSKKEKRERMCVCVCARAEWGGGNNRKREHDKKKGGWT